MDFELSDRAKELRESLLAFMDERVYPAEPEWAAAVKGPDGPHVHPPIIEELKTEARGAGLWNLFLPDDEHGAGLSNLDYAPLAEIMGRTRIASEACNCCAPDTGNMEVLHLFGTDEQKQRWLRPLLDGEIRSAFAMTEPDGRLVGRDEHRAADRARRRRVRPQRPQVVHAERDAPEPADPDRDGQDEPGRRDIRAAVDGPGALDTTGVTVLRSPHVFGYNDHEGHGEVSSTTSASRWRTSSPGRAGGS